MYCRSTMRKRTGGAGGVLLLAGALATGTGPGWAAKIGCPSAGQGKVLECGSQGVASWVTPPDSWPWSRITLRPTTLAGYGIQDAAPKWQADSHTIFFGDDAAALTAGTSYTVSWPYAASLTGLECQVITAPTGAPIVFDLRAGTPLATLYATPPAIAADGFSTVMGTPGTLLQSPTPLAAGTAFQLQVVSVGIGEKGQGLRCTFYESHEVTDD